MSQSSDGREFVSNHAELSTSVAAGGDTTLSYSLVTSETILEAGGLQTEEWQTCQ